MPRHDDVDRRPEDVLIEALLDATSRRVCRRFQFGPFLLDVGDQRLFRQETPVHLPPKEFETLRLLVERRGRLITKQELLETVWGGVCVDEGTIAQRISFLRRILGRAEHGGPYIETVPRRGYRFVAAVSEWFESGPS